MEYHLSSIPRALLPACLPAFLHACLQRTFFFPIEHFFFYKVSPVVPGSFKTLPLWSTIYRQSHENSWLPFLHACLQRTFFFPTENNIFLQCYIRRPGFNFNFSPQLYQSNLSFIFIHLHYPSDRPTFISLFIFL